MLRPGRAACCKSCCWYCNEFQILFGDKAQHWDMCVATHPLWFVFPFISSLHQLPSRSQRLALATLLRSSHTCWFGLWGLLPVLSAEDPQVEGSAQGGWFSLQMGPVGHLRLQLDLDANSRVPQPALHLLREWWPGAGRHSRPEFPGTQMALDLAVPKAQRCPDCPLLLSPSPCASLAFLSLLCFPSLPYITFPFPISFLSPFSQSKANTC